MKLTAAVCQLTTNLGAGYLGSKFLLKEGSDWCISGSATKFKPQTFNRYMKKGRNIKQCEYLKNRNN